MRIGIVPCVDRSGGGVFQYSMSLLTALDQWRDAARAYEFTIWEARPWGRSHRIATPELKDFVRRGWPVYPLHPPQAWDWARECRDRLLGSSRRSPARPPPTRSAAPATRDLNHVHHRPEQQRYLQSHGVELLLFGAPEELAFECGLPYVLPVHDIQHRLQPEFPEVSADGEWERREYVFRNGCRYATLLVADSETGKEDILNCYGPYGVTADKVKVLPYLPGAPTAISSASDRRALRARYHLPDRYLFYPAQFWPHKNHVRLIKALGHLATTEQLTIPLVCCGSYRGALREQVYREVLAAADAAGIRSRLHVLGYVTDTELGTLYDDAVALVFPTFFGPTNIPILEAWSHGCPVLTSDIRGCRDQAGDAAVLVDPRSIESLADGIRRLWNDETLRQSLIARGRTRLQQYTAADFSQRVIEIIQEAVQRVPKSRMS